MSTCGLDPEVMIEKLPELMQEVTKRCWGLHTEIDLLVEQWHELGRAGGKRADHAADMMCRLRFQLDDLAKFCKTASDNITKMKADPFCRHQTA